MEKQVEIEKSVSECKMCNDTAEMFGQFADCTKCPKTIGTWVDTVSNFWGTYALVIMPNGSVEKVPMCRVRVIGENDEKSRD